MKTLVPLVVFLTVTGCAPRPDPRVQAAQDFQRTVDELITRDERRAERLSSLRLGMSDEEVLKTAGAPSRRQTLSSGEPAREVWTYGGELKELGTLTFEDGRLTQIRVN